MEEIDKTRIPFTEYRIHTSEQFKKAVEKVGGYEFEERGTIQVKVSRPT